MKKAIQIPPQDEFVNHGIAALTKAGYTNATNYTFPLAAKYQQWIENDWRDGYDRPIINWRSKILNIIPYLRPMAAPPQNYLTNVGQDLDNIIKVKFGT